MAHLTDSLVQGGMTIQINYMGVSKNRRKYPQIIHFKFGFSIIFTIHFGGKIPLFSVQNPYKCTLRIIWDLNKTGGDLKSQTVTMDSQGKPGKDCQV